MKIENYIDQLLDNLPRKVETVMQLKKTALFMKEKFQGLKDRMKEKDSKKKTKKGSKKSGGAQAEEDIIENPQGEYTLEKKSLQDMTPEERRESQKIERNIEKISQQMQSFSNLVFSDQRRHREMTEQEENEIFDRDGDVETDGGEDSMVDEDDEDEDDGDGNGEAGGNRIWESLLFSCQSRLVNDMQMTKFASVNLLLRKDFGEIKSAGGAENDEDEYEEDVDYSQRRKRGAGKGKRRSTRENDSFDAGDEDDEDDGDVDGDGDTDDFDEDDDLDNE